MPTIKLPVADVTIETYRQEIPSTCPECGANLLEPDALTCFEYVSEGQGASIDESGEIDWTGRSADGGCSTIDDVWLCKKCDATLASGKETRRERDVTAAPLAHLKSFDPPALETFAEHWRRQARHLMKMALRDARAANWVRAYWYLGRADAAVSVSYDTNHERAYGARVALDRTRRAVDARHDNR